MHLQLDELFDELLETDVQLEWIQLILNDDVDEVEVDELEVNDETEAEIVDDLVEFDYTDTVEVEVEVDTVEHDLPLIDDEADDHETE